MGNPQLFLDLGKEVEAQDVKLQAPAKPAKHYPWLDALVNLDVTPPRNEEQTMLFDEEEDEDDFEQTSSNLTQSIADGIFISSVKKAKLPEYDKSNTAPAILAKASGNALNYIEDPYGEFCELEIKQLERHDKRRIEDRLASLNLLPNIVATTLLQLFYERRRFNQRAFDVSLAKFSMFFNEDDQEKIHNLRGEISKHVRHQLGELHWQDL